MTIIQASFFWQNDRPGGLGFTLGPPGFTPEQLTEMFEGKALKDFIRQSDMSLGSDIVADYLSQLVSLGRLKSDQISLDQVILAGFNIIWLSSRGFIPNDEYNGPQFIKKP